MTPIDAIILGRCYDRPCWAKSFYKVKACLTRLVDLGYLERIKPPGNEHTRGKNMVQLTRKGADAIERHWDAQIGANPT